MLGLFLTDGPVAAAQGNDYLARIVAQDQRAARLAKTERERAVTTATSLDRSTDGVASTVDQVEQRYGEVQALLAQARSRLSRLSANARQLADIQALIKQLNAQKAAADAARAAAAHRAKAGGIPADYLALYRAAAQTCPGCRGS